MFEHESESDVLPSVPWSESLSSGRSGWKDLAGNRESGCHLL